MRTNVIEEEQEHRPQRTWLYITTKKGLLKARKWIRRYLRQSIIDEHGDKDPARLAIDVETYRKYPQTIPSKVPRAIWNGQYWEGYIRTIQIGFDTDTRYKIRDMQFIIDVQALGEELVAAALKDLLETAVLISHNATYELQFLKAHLDIEPEWVIDLMLLSQIERAGDRTEHNLAACYERYLRGKGIFEGYTGMTFLEYKQHKKRMQKAVWGLQLDEFRESSSDEHYSKLIYKQLQYAADDVRIVYPLYDAITEQIDDFKAKHEKAYKEGKGIEEVIGLELSLRPFFSGLEQLGVRFDVEYYERRVLPLMRRKLKEATLKLAEYPEFRPKRGEKERHLLFVAKGVALGMVEEQGKKRVDGKMVPVTRKVSLTSVAAKTLKPFLKSIFPGIEGLSITQKSMARSKEIRIKWVGKFRRRDIYEAVKGRLSENNGYMYKPELTINMNAKEQVKKALSAALGKQVVKCDEDYLKSLMNKKHPQRTEIIERYLQWQQANGYYSRYGENLMRWVTPRGMIHAQIAQIGRDEAEMATGRSSCNNPNLHNMSGRATLYKWGGKKGISSSKLVRSAFIPEEGCTFWDCDFSQIEPRMAAQITKDKNLIKLFNEGLDQHRMTAAAITRKKYEDVTVEERDTHGKTVNLASSFGMGAYLMREHIRKATNGDWYPTLDEARDICKTYLITYSGIAKKSQEAEETVTKRLKKVGTMAKWKMDKNDGHRRPFGFIADVLGRPRFFFIPREMENSDKWPDKKLSRNFKPEDEDGFYYNEFMRRVNKCRLAGYNHTIQGSAAEVLKFAELYVYRAIRKKGWNPDLNRVVIILHDELLLQVEDQYAVEAGEMLRTCMMRAGQKFVKVVPIELQLGQGSNWHKASKAAKKVTAESVADQARKLKRRAA